MIEPLDDDVGLLLLAVVVPERRAEASVWRKYLTPRWSESMWRSPIRPRKPRAALGCSVIDVGVIGT